MKTLYIFVSVVTFVQAQKIYLPQHGLPPAEPPKSRSSITATIIQRLDNFDSSNNNLWNMRYLSNPNFFRKGGPIFIMLGAEWSIDTSWVESGQMYDMAKIHGAYMFYTEHRFYGQSYPTTNLTSHNLKYLTSDQALADFANFIRQIKVYPYFSNSKVVVFGGSYAGSLAVWMRAKYPDLVHAAVSSSAPLLAKIDFYEYNSVIQKTLGPDCASIITSGSKKVLRLLSLGYVTKVQKDFNLCWPVNTNSTSDTIYFFLSIATPIGNLVQYGNNSIISDFCTELKNPIWTSDYSKLAAYSRKESMCKGNYNHLVNSMSNTDLNTGNSRQWLYQQCTQFGFFQTSWASTALYGQTIPIEFYNKWCIDFFGPSFTPSVTANGIAATNAKYGALNPRVTRVVSVHGTIDPWHAVGLSNNLNSEAPVIVVPESSHCADLFSLSASDSYEIYQAKLAVQNYVAEWLK